MWGEKIINPCYCSSKNPSPENEQIFYLIIPDHEANFFIVGSYHPPFLNKFINLCYSAKDFIPILDEIISYLNENAYRFDTGHLASALRQLKFLCRDNPDAKIEVREDV